MGELLDDFLCGSRQNVYLRLSLGLVCALGHDIYLDLGLGAGRTDDKGRAALELVVHDVLTLKLHLLDSAVCHAGTGTRHVVAGEVDLVRPTAVSGLSRSSCMSSFMRWRPETPGMTMEMVCSQ